MYDTIFAPISSVGSSAISVFRVSGDNSSKILRLLIKNKILPVERKLTLKKIYHPFIKDEIIDICLICWMPKPNSYTGEDSFEIFCHGGNTTSRAFINCFSKIKGLRFATAGEFSKRALVNGKIDLVKAEAINDIILAENEKQRSLSIKQLNRGLSIPINLWRKIMINALSKIEATIDFSDEEDVPEKINISTELSKIIMQIKNVLQEGDLCDLIAQGLKVTFTGPPNSGKSSLFNYIIKKEKSIVTKIPGTTRDVIEKKINYNGYQITFFDTAGIRKTKNLVEKEGIKKALKAAKEADLVLNVNDITNIKKNEIKRSWQIFNKIDKGNKAALKIQYKGKKIFFVSAKTGEGVEKLLEAIYKHISNKTKRKEQNEFFYTNHRQKGDLERALAELSSAINERDEEIVAEHLRAAINNLERILGQIDVEDVLGNIFSNFCVGM